MSDPAARPLLSIAIPTYNRSRELGELLTVLAPQLAKHPEIELLLCDNASPDDTQKLIEDFIRNGLVLRYIRHPENIGADRNFVSCFENARGVFFWLCGDDDIILPGALDRILPHLLEPPLDILYVTSYGFRENWQSERHEDPLHRRFHRFTSARQFAKVVNIMLTFISGIIVNRDRLLELPHEEPAALLNTNLIQLGWCLPLLLEHRRSAVLWERSLAGRVANGGGYDVGRVFGTGLRATLARLLPGRSDLQNPILNYTIRRWLPSNLYALRADRNARMGLGHAVHDFRTAYGGNPRFWLFAYPVLRLPLPLAKIWLRLGTLLNMVIYVLTVPRFWRAEG